MRPGDGGGCEWFITRNGLPAFSYLLLRHMYIASIYAGMWLYRQLGAAISYVVATW
jgi:hypothetical protein